MALGRKKSGGRKEPRFEGGASLDGLRLNAWDRVGNSEDEAPKRRSARDDAPDDDEPPREPRPRRSRAQARKDKKTSRQRSRTGFGRLVYWEIGRASCRERVCYPV